MVIGLHDPTGQFTSLVKSYAGGEVVVVAGVGPGEHLGDGDTLRHLYDKELLLSRSTHVIIAVHDIAALSILMAAVRRLLDGALSGVLAIGFVSMEMLYSAARVDGNEFDLTRTIDEGRFMLCETLNQTVLDAFLQEN